MRADEHALAEIAASVADGDSVDWTAVEARVPAADRPLVRHLRLVESISTLYRTLHAEPDEDAAAPRPTPDGPAWGPLVLRDRIGTGTSCEVYRAWDSSLHREVALKLLKDDGVGSPDGHARVLDEARRLARVRHQHVVQVYGAEQHDGRVGLWMELVDGESLEQIVRTRGPYGAAEAAVIGQDLCAALAAVHGAGLLHRDIKAQNVLRESGGRTVLMDFGTGEELRRKAGTNRLVGTPLYLAPEIFRGHAASVQSDLYSLGVLLFYLVTGEFPITAGSMEGLARAHAESAGRRLRDMRPDLPTAFVAVVERALDANPERRFRTAGEMDLALRSWPGEPAAAPPDAATAGGSRRWPFVAAAALLLALTLSLIVWTRQVAAPPSSGEIKRIAVAPMTPIDPSAAPPFFAEGLTDQLISTLGQIQALRVKVSVPAGGMSGSNPGQPAADVDAVLQTTLLGAGGIDGSPPRVRVNARLIAAGTGTVMWSQTFERALCDTFGLQTAMAREIANAIKAAVTSDEEARLKQVRRTTPEAEAAFLEGRAHIEAYGAYHARHALDAFTRANKADPNHAAARAGAARAYFTLGSWGALSQPVARALALEQAQKALELDDSLPDAHATLAAISFFYDWNWKRAEQGCLRSLELNPSFRFGRILYSQILAAAGRTTEAAAQAALAVDLEPFSVMAHRNHATVLYYHRDFDAAEQAVRRSLELEGQAPSAWIILGRIAEARGDLETARQHTNHAAGLMQDAPALLRVQQLRLAALAGERAQARAGLEALHREADAAGVLWNPLFDAYVHLALGDVNGALGFLEQAAGQREPSLLWLSVDPRVDSLRDHPRFVQILRSLGLTDVS